ncbi:helix-turn-helix transcriptional regulator [Candidatus Poriferisocius sp.]|uniref:helix-turn-helix transcriptional regulator n=1 Tax=Candidatus Poriferisocius sp. TaxID=3101276 RepID=UPI003B020B00
MRRHSQLRSPGQIGRILRERRAELGFSQDEVARRAGVSRPWLSAVENGKTSSQINELLRLAHALGLAWELAPRRMTSIEQAEAQRRAAFAQAGAAVAKKTRSRRRQRRSEQYTAPEGMPIG